MSLNTLFYMVFDIHPLDWFSLGAALFSAIIVGLERQLKGKPIGIRTSALIVVGTYTFICCSQAFVIDTGSTVVQDPSRIIGQVITGIGFLGAGVMMSRNGTVLGVTSAAAIWVLAAIGVCIGIGYPLVGIKLALIVVLILVGVDIIESGSQKLTTGAHRRYQDWRSKP